MQADVIIIGAGAAGLLAARILSTNGQKVVVLEARNRIGGRIHTLHDSAFTQPIEGGAEFVHGQLPLTLQLLHEAGLKTKAAGGELWQSNNGILSKREDFILDDDQLLQALNSLKEDVSVAQFIKEHFAAPQHEDLRTSLQQYVEGYYAGDTAKASTFALRDELQGANEEDMRVAGGYGSLMDFLYQQCLQHGVLFHLDEPVTTIHWQKNAVCIQLKNNTDVKAGKVIITVPVGVLQTPAGTPGSLTFLPEVPQVAAAAQALGFGAVIKMAIAFTNPFWEDMGMKNMNFLFSDECIPTWWTQHPQQSSLLTGWCAGPNAAALKAYNDNAILDLAITSLAHCFAMPADAVKEQIKAARVWNWAADPYTFGGYSYLSVQSSRAIAQLSAPVEDTLYFAGEGLHNGMEIGTVEAALQSGQRVAQQIMAAN